MKNELLTSLSDAFPKPEITARCENKLIQVYRVLDKTLVQSESVLSFKKSVLEMTFVVRSLIEDNYLFEIDDKTGLPRKKFKK